MKAITTITGTTLCTYPIQPNNTWLETNAFPFSIPLDGRHFTKDKFLPDHSFERMTARLCAMEVTPPPPDAETAYAATGDHHLFLAAAIQGGFKNKLEFMRYDVPAAFLQLLLPTPCYGRVPPDLPMATPLSRSFVASTAPESPTRSSTKIIRSSSSPWATSNLKATYESLRSPDNWR
jgi:hypothetical protein